jgi:hypothetical protein
MRVVLRTLLLLLLTVVASALGLLLALVLTPPGRALLARNTEEVLATVLRGDVRIGRITGSFLRDLRLERVSIRDTSGAVFLTADEISVRFRIPLFLDRRYEFDHVEAIRPVIQIERYASGRWNYQDVLRLGEGPGGGPPSRIELRDVRIVDGSVTIRYPWPPRALTGRARDSVIAVARTWAGRVVAETRHGTQRVVTLSGVTAGLPRIRISTPDRKPLLAVIDTLRADVSDPLAQVRDLQGVIEQQGDSLRLWVTRVRLPRTLAALEGTVSWPGGDLLFDFRARAPQLALADLRFISPLFPDMTGSADATAKWETRRRTAYDIRDLVLRDGDERIEGALVAVVDNDRGLGVRRLRLRLTDVNLDKVRPFLDTLPFDGRLTGPVQADGWLDDLVASGDWRFTDLAVPNAPVSTARFNGRIRTGATLVFDDVRLTAGDFDLRTVRNLAPAVILPGRLQAVGTVDGPLDNVTFDGTAVHRDGALPASRATGVARLDLRGDSAAVEADLQLDPLSFDGIRTAFPSLTAQGELRGRVRLDGPVTRMAFEADVVGEIGAIRGGGVGGMGGTRLIADGVQLDFERLNVEALSGRPHPTSLNGRLSATGVVDSGVAPEGSMMLVLGAGAVGGVPVDSAVLAARAAGGVVTVDSAAADAAGIRLDGRGTLGWARPADGAMAFTLSADSLTRLDSLAQAVTGFTRDTSANWHTLDGVVRGELGLRGSLDSLEATGSVVVNGLVFEHARLGRLETEFAWQGGARPLFGLRVAADSATRRDQFLRDVDVRATGPIDSLGWRVAGDVGASSSVFAEGRLLGADSARTVALDEAELRFVNGTWRLEAPTTIALADTAPMVSGLSLVSQDGNGHVRADGRLPLRGAGDFTLEALGVSIQDLYALAQLDTTGVGGTIGLAFELRGTREAPVLRGTTTIEDLRMGETIGPFAQGLFTYEARRLEGGLALWRTGRPVLLVTADLPLDLALTTVKDRTLPGAVSVRALADSVDLAVLEALTAGVRRVRGLLKADVRIEGTWDQPMFGGSIELTDGAMTVTGLNTRFTNIQAKASLSGDSLVVERYSMDGGAGRAEGEGMVRFEGLTRPVLELRVRAQRFRVMDRPQFLSLTASAALQLAGPLDAPVLTGGAVADQGVLQFADLVSKRVIDLDDPENAVFVDTTLVRRRKLGTDLVTRMVQALRIDDFHLVIGQDFWLRSNEANIKLSGDVQVNKLGRVYRVDGVMTAERGRYAVLTKDFDVTKGNVRFFGTPDLNAALDIEAQHVVRTVRNEELPIVAKVGGTLLSPRLSLSSTARPPISETDLVSYLMVGAPLSDATQSGQQAVVSTVVGLALGAASNELERALISDLGIPVDMLQIRTVVGPGQQGQASIGAFSLSAGKQLGERVFLSLNAGFCPNSGASFDYRNFGAGIEYRFSRSWRAQLVMEPALRYCGVTNLGTNVSTSSLYQFGADVLWEREF